MLFQDNPLPKYMRCISHLFNLFAIQEFCLEGNAENEEILGNKPDLNSAQDFLSFALRL